MGHEKHMAIPKGVSPSSSVDLLHVSEEASSSGGKSGEWYCMDSRAAGDPAAHSNMNTGDQRHNSTIDQNHIEAANSQFCEQDVQTDSKSCVILPGLSNVEACDTSTASHGMAGVILTFNKHPRNFNEALMESESAKSLKDEGIDLLPAWANGANILLRGLTAEIMEHSPMTPQMLGPHHVIVAQSDEALKTPCPVFRHRHGGPRPRGRVRMSLRHGRARQRRSTRISSRSVQGVCASHPATIDQPKVELYEVIC